MKSGDPELLEITLENTSVTYKYKDGRVILFQYSGQAHDVIRELMERYLLPQKRYLEHPYHPGHPGWGQSAV